MARTAAQQKTANRPMQASALSACACAQTADQTETDAAFAASVFAFFWHPCVRIVLRLRARIDRIRFYRYRLCFAVNVLCGAAAHPC